MSHAAPRPLSAIHVDAVTLACALELIDGLVMTTRHNQAGFLAVIALVTPLARKLADDLEEAL